MINSEKILKETKNYMNEINNNDKSKQEYQSNGQLNNFSQSNSNASLSSFGSFPEGIDDGAQTNGQLADSKNKYFHRVFRNKGISKNELLIDRYSCALQRDILLLQGFLYVSTNHFCYYTNIVGFIHQVIIPISKIKSIIKKNTAFLFANAIQFETKTGQTYFMTSFVNRDLVYNQLIKLWEQNKKKQQFLSDSVSNSVCSTLSRNTGKCSSNNDINIKENIPRNENINNNKTPSFHLNANSPKENCENLSSNDNEKQATTHVCSKQHHTLHRANHKHSHNKKIENLFRAEETIQIDTKLPKYLPKINSTKDLIILKVILLITVILIGSMTFLSFLIRIKTNRMISEILESQNTNKEILMNNYAKYNEWMDEEKDTLKDHILINSHVKLNWDEWEVIDV